MDTPGIIPSGTHGWHGTHPQTTFVSGTGQRGRHAMRPAKVLGAGSCGRNSALSSRAFMATGLSRRECAEHPAATLGRGSAHHMSNCAYGGDSSGEPLRDGGS
eukprot:5956942-Prymnesium_polylepis.1